MPHDYYEIPQSDRNTLDEYFVRAKNSRIDFSWVRNSYLKRNKCLKFDVGLMLDVLDSLHMLSEGTNALKTKGSRDPTRGIRTSMSLSLSLDGISQMLIGKAQRHIACPLWLAVEKIAEREEESDAFRKIDITTNNKPKHSSSDLDKTTSSHCSTWKKRKWKDGTN